MLKLASSTSMRSSRLKIIQQEKLQASTTLNALNTATQASTKLLWNMSRKRTRTAGKQAQQLGDTFIRHKKLNAYSEGYGWVEFGGSGIFRPEVTQPLGVKVPVIAWGLGVDRLFMMHAGIDDIRSIFSQDLEWLRRKQVI